MGERTFDVVYAVGDVVQSGPSGDEEPPDRGLGPERTQQLDVTRSRPRTAPPRRPDRRRAPGGSARPRASARILVDRRLEVGDRDAHVVDVGEFDRSSAIPEVGLHAGYEIVRLRHVIRGQGERTRDGRHAHRPQIGFGLGTGCAPKASRARRTRPTPGTGPGTAPARRARRRRSWRWTRGTPGRRRPCPPIDIPAPAGARAGAPRSCACPPHRSAAASSWPRPNPTGWVRADARPAKPVARLGHGAIRSPVWAEGPISGGGRSA